MVLRMIRIRRKKFDSDSNSYSRNYFSTQFSSTFRIFFPTIFQYIPNFFPQNFSVQVNFFPEILCPGERSELLEERWISNKKCCTVLYNAALVSRVWVINRI